MTDLLDERSGGLPERVPYDVNGSLSLALLLLGQRDVRHLFAGVKQRVPCEATDEQ